MSVKGKYSIPTRFKFSKHSTIGANDALEDKFMLEDAFVDVGTLRIFRDTNRPECIVLGRTGSGKTALIETLAATEASVVQLDPKNLALSYLSDNQVIRFFADLGVNMELFYHLLWRHVFAVEIIKKKYKIDTEERQTGFINNILQKLSSNKKKERAIRYLVEWGASFWKESDYRISETTRKLEKDLSNSLEGQLGGRFAGIVSGEGKAAFHTATKLTEEERGELKAIGQSVVDKVQMQQLAEVLEFLSSDILNDPQNKMFITIDRLDENWINDSLRYHLIRALIDAVREFNYSVKPLKIIIALRVDLLERVFKYTKGNGYQEEKYRSMQLELKWVAAELEELLDTRVAIMVKPYDPSGTARARDYLPNRIKDKGDPITFILSRTMYRPRDVISFFNECIRQAHGQSKISRDNVLGAEGVYSQNRLRALADEWADDFSDLYEAALIMTGWNDNFTWANTKDRFQDDLLTFLIENEKSGGNKEITKLLNHCFNMGDIEAAFSLLMKTFYRTGLVGVRVSQTGHLHWSFEGQETAVEDFSDLPMIYHIHPGFWRVLKIRPVH